MKPNEREKRGKEVRQKDEKRHKDKIRGKTE